MQIQNNALKGQHITNPKATPWVSRYHPPDRNALGYEDEDADTEQRPERATYHQPKGNTLGIRYHPPNRKAFGYEDEDADTKQRPERAT